MEDIVIINSTKIILSIFYLRKTIARRLICIAVFLIHISLNKNIMAQAGISFHLLPSSIAFVVDEIDLIPEGIAYDSATQRFFLSSKSKDKVIAVGADGSHTDFIKTRQDSVLGSLGLKVDAERRRLWVLSNRQFGENKVSVVHVFDADDATLIKRFFTPTVKQYHLNDLVLTNEGGAYITDTQSSHIFMVPPDLNELQLFIVDSLIKYPNGITISPDNKLLYVESDENGIIIVDLKDKSITPIKNIMSIATGGLDGIVYYNNSIIGVANSQHDFAYIARYYMSDDSREIISASIIDEDNPEFNIPTTCVIVDNNLYVLAATCLRVYNRNQMDRKELLKKPVVLKYKLDN